MFRLLRVVAHDDGRTTASRRPLRRVPGSCRRRARDPILQQRRPEVNGVTWAPARFGSDRPRCAGPTHARALSACPAGACSPETLRHKAAMVEPRQGDAGDAAGRTGTGRPDRTPGLCVAGPARAAPGVAGTAAPGHSLKEPEPHARPDLPGPTPPRREGSREPGDQEGAAWPPPDTRC